MSDGGGYREKARERFGGRCERCGTEVAFGDVEVHHVDRNRGNADHDNLESLCRDCHIEEHHGDDPLWGLVVSVPRPVLELVDDAVEAHGYDSRSEAVCRAVVDQYESDQDGMFGGPSESVSAWFADGAHAEWSKDRAVPPDSDGGGG